MATNVFNNTAKITKKAMNNLRNNLVLVPRVNRTYEQEFNKGEGKIGDTVNVRVPGLGGTVVTGKVAVPNSFADSYVPLTLVQKNVSLRFSSKELKLNAEDSPEFERSVLGPQMIGLINDLEAGGFALCTGFAAQGTPGTAPTDLAYFLNAKAALADAAAPMDDQIFAFLNPWTESSMVNGLKGLFQDSTEIAQQYKKGVMGRAAGMSFLTSQNVPTHTTGTWSGTPVINDAGAALVSGGSTLPIDGFGGATDSFKEGDVLTVAGVYSVNPVSKLSTGQLQKFTVTADYAATANAMAALPVTPAFITSGPTQTVTALP
ncbi:MAG: P22 phage major capsid protein family protein, partial [Minisyncoccia bacterium]